MKWRVLLPLAAVTATVLVFVVTPLDIFREPLINVFREPPTDVAKDTEEKTVLCDAYWVSYEGTCVPPGDSPASDHSVIACDASVRANVSAASQCR
jgi:hypothetical protein